MNLQWNKNQHSTLLVILAVSLIQGCSSKGDFAEYIEFDKVINLKESDLDKISISTPLYVVREMVSTENELLILTKAQDSIIKVFDNSSLDYLGTFGKHGQGPTEFFYPYQDGFRHFKQDQISIVDRRSIRKLAIDRNISSIEIKESDKVKLPGSIIPLWEGNFLNDSTVIGLNQSPENNQLVMYNYVKNKIHFDYEYPPIVYNTNLERRNIDFYAKLKITKDKEKLALAYRKLPLIRIIDLVNSTDLFLKVENHLLESYIVDNDGIPLKDNTYFYYDIDVTKNWIAAIYRKEKSSAQETSYLSKNEMHIFDIKGNPVCKIILEDWMSNFAVLDQPTRIIFHHPENESELYQYTLPFENHE